MCDTAATGKLRIVSHIGTNEFFFIFKCNLNYYLICKINSMNYWRVLL